VRITRQFRFVAECVNAVLKISIPRYSHQFLLWQGVPQAVRAQQQGVVRSEFSLAETDVGEWAQAAKTAADAVSERVVAQFGLADGAALQLVLHGGVVAGTRYQRPVAKQIQAAVA
jgi:hypothetical protein